MSGKDKTTNPHHAEITVVTDGTKKQTQREACLVVIYGEHIGRRVALGRQPVGIGRSSKCEVQVDQESISRNHCRITYTNSGYSIRDLGSTNGTYVNDELVDEINLRDGDQIKVGRTIMKFITSGNIEAQYHEEIYRLMTIDALTDVRNKRFFDETLSREVSRSLRYERIFSVIIFDIDHFKNVNDTYGHLAGDSVLRQLGMLIKNSVRRDDFVCRIGGEEFAILLPEVEVEGGKKTAEKIRTAVERAVFSFEGAEIPVTISAGVAQWSSETKSGQDITRLADEKLYEAKRSGRNRVCH